MGNMRLEPSFSADFDEASTIEFGRIEVLLAKRKAGSSYPCAEVLQVYVPSGATEANMQEYTRFHRSYVLHRVKHDWKEQYAFVYVTQDYELGDSIEAVIERGLAFIMMHSDLGEHYQRWLYKVGVFVADEGVQSSLEKILRIFGPQPKPILPHVVGKDHDLAGRMR